MINEEIKDEIRHSTDSSIQALTLLVRDIQNDNRKHREEEMDSRVKYRTEMLSAVRDEMKVTVNGKIDNLTQQVKDMDDRFKEHCEIVEPIIRQFEDRKGFWNTLSVSGKNIGLISGAIIGIGIIITALMKISK